MIIDAVIPYHPKDKELLHWCVSGIRDHLDVARILVVGSQECRPDVKRVGATFIDEDSVVEGVTASTCPGERWGWYFQQILKLGITDQVNTDYYLAVDADTVFLREAAFFNASGRPFYATAIEDHKPYFDVFEQLLGFRANKEYSFTVHHMVYNRRIVEEMREQFRDQKPWYMNIIRYVEPQAPWFSISQFSEQETYGHYIKALYPDEVNIRPLPWNIYAVVPTAQMLKELARGFYFCSFHSWLRR